MANIKIGWHTSPVGVGVPKSFWEALDNAGITAIAKGADTMSGVFDLQEIAKNSSVSHVCVWRKSNSTSGGYQYDTPNYGLPAAQAAQIHWEETKKVIPPELDKSITWLELINEVDKNLSDWLGYFSYEIAKLANSEGYKVLSFGWAAGEPEPEHWFTPGMQKYLEYCSQNKDKAGVSVHEYTLDINKTFEQAYPWLVGRFEAIHDACDGKFDRPTIFVSEFGYTYDNIQEDWEKIAQFLIDCGELYAKYPNVLGAAIWYLGTGSNWKDIGLKWQPHIESVETLILQIEYPDPPIVEPPPPPVLPPDTALISIEIQNDAIVTSSPFDEKTINSVDIRYETTDGTKSNWQSISGIPSLDVHSIELRTNVSEFIELEVVDGGDILPPTEPPIDPPVEPPPPTQPPLVRGDLIIDVSYWNGKIDWAAYKEKGLKGAIIRASNGINQSGSTLGGTDGRYWENIQECKNLDIPIGVYHFLNGDYSPVQQVIHFSGILAQTIGLGASITLGVYLDAEPATVGGTPANQQFLIDAGNTLLAELDKLELKHLAGWYSRASWWNTVVPATATWPQQYLAWVAQWPSSSPISTPPSINTPLAMMNGFKKNDIWQFTSQGEDIFAVNDKTSLDVNYWLGSEVIQPPQPPPPPPSSKVDLLPYFKGSVASKGQLYEVETRINGSGVGQQRHQTHVEGNKFYFTKGGDGTAKHAQWEELSYDDDYIRRYRDSSMSETQFYTLEDDGVPFSKWCPRRMAVGETYQRMPDVTVYNKSNCAMVSKTLNVGSWIKLEKIHESLQCYNGITINNVAELHWYNNLSQPPIEVYYFSSDPRIQGLAGWKYDNKIALVSEIHAPGQRPDSVREAICL